MSKPPAPLIPPDLLAMMEKGVSAIVSSCSIDLRPSLMRAIGSDIAAGGKTITVYVSRPQSRQLLQDIASTGRISVVFSSPMTTRAVQVKGNSARVRSADDSDATVLQRYLKSMEEEVAQVGFAPAFTRAMLAHKPDEVVAISFEPGQAFDQTPGPKAGAPLSQSAGQT